MDHDDALDQQLWEFVYEMLPEQDGEPCAAIRSDPGSGTGLRARGAASELVAEAARAEAPRSHSKSSGPHGRGRLLSPLGVQCQCRPLAHARGPRTDRSGRHGSDLRDGLGFCAGSGAPIQCR